MQQRFGFRSVVALAIALFLALSFAFVTPDGVLAMASRQRLPHPGFRAVSIWHPSDRVRMDFAVWYPSPRFPRDVILDGWSIHVSKDSVASLGRYPIILISHDTASCRLASHDLAANLARQGFVVVAPTHPGDSVNDTRALFTAQTFFQRPQHLLLALKSLAEHNFFAPIIDVRRIGILGVGAGAITALQMAGAAPDLSLLPNHCPESFVLDPLCTNWARKHHDAMRASFAALTAQNGISRLTPELATLFWQASSATTIAPPPAKETATEATTEQPQKNEHPKEEDASLLRALAPGILENYVPEPALLAVGLLTPGGINMFPNDAIKNVAVPVGILSVHDDAVYPHETSGKRLQDLLPQRPSSRMLHNATHFDVQAPCPPIYLDTFPALCGPQGDDPIDSRTLRNEFFTRFFEKYLGEPLPPPVTTEEDKETKKIPARH